MNQTLIRMISRLESADKATWIVHLPALLLAFNATRSAITGYSPYFLFYGRRPRLPIDFLFPAAGPKSAHKYTTKFVAEAAAGLRRAIDQAASSSRKEARRQKRYYDFKARAVELIPGDQVLLRHEHVRGRRKLASVWQDEPFEVLERVAPDIPLYRIRNCTNQQERTAHRNRLFLLSPSPAGDVARSAASPASVNVMFVGPPTLADEESEGLEWTDDEDREIPAPFTLPTPDYPLDLEVDLGPTDTEEEEGAIPSTTNQGENFDAG